MPDLNLDLNYFSHQKTMRLVARAGKNAELYLIRLWVHCGKHHPDTGTLAGYIDAELIEIMGLPPSNATSMLQAMLDVGYIHRTENGFQVHDWLDHQGHLAWFHERAKNAAKKRWGKSRSNATSNATTGGVAMPHTIPSVPSLPTKPTDTHGATNAPIPVPLVFDFEKFWGIYPRRRGVKVGKKNAMTVFRRVIKTFQDYADLLKATENYGVNNDFPKDAERFLKNDFWRDWVNQRKESEHGKRPENIGPTAKPGKYSDL